jgi:type IV pilus assembly protein PilY1
MSTQNNGIADVVYAGDLQGNLWKFDLSSADPAKWKVTFGTPEVPQAMFTTASGQPITTRPDVTVQPAVRGGTLVSFGTGRYLSESDPASVEAQALYGIWDNGARVTEADLQTQMVVDNGAGQDGSTYRVTTHAVDVPVDGIVTGDNAITTDNYYRFRRGWRLGLADAGERVVSDPSIRFGRLVVSTIVPSSDPCASGGTGFTYAIDVLTGNRSETASFDTNGDSRIDKSDYITLGDVQEPKNASAVRFDQMPTGPSFIRVRQDGLDFAVVNKSNGKTESERLNGNQKKSRRAAWEHIK